MTYDLDHYNALCNSLDNERIRLLAAGTSKDHAFRPMNIKRIEKEIQGEIEFLKTKGVDIQSILNQDDDLLNELFS